MELPESSAITNRSRPIKYPRRGGRRWGWRTRRDRLLALIASGSVKTQWEAADALMVTQQYVSYLVKQLGLRLGPPRPPERPLVTLVCPGCGNERIVPAWQADQRKSDYCRACGPRCRRVPSVTIRCPRCGKERDLFPGDARHRKTEYCRECSDRLRKQRSRWPTKRRWGAPHAR